MVVSHNVFFQCMCGEIILVCLGGRKKVTSIAPRASLDRQKGGSRTRAGSRGIHEVVGGGEGGLTGKHKVWQWSKCQAHIVTKSGLIKINVRYNSTRGPYLHLGGVGGGAPLSPPFFLSYLFFVIHFLRFFFFLFFFSFLFKFLLKC